MPAYRVVFTPLGKSVTVPAGTSLLEAAGEAGIALSNVCGGDGICGRCKMIVRQGRCSGEVSPLLTREEIRQGVVLGCRSMVEGDLVVEIPQETRAREKLAIDHDARRFRSAHPGITGRDFAAMPLVSKIFLELDPPSLDDNLADCQRIEREVAKSTGLAAMQTGLKVIKRIPDLLREGNFQVTAIVGRRRDIGEIVDIEPGNCADRNYIAVVDIGTSTIVLHLVDVNAMQTVDSAACFNSQAIHGREVTARIMAAEKKGAKRLQQQLADDINQILSRMATRGNVHLRDITGIVCSGNTTMTHFLLGLPTANIRRQPFISATVEPPPLRAAEVGLKINPRGLLFSVPCISSWVGGDVTAGILATGLDEIDGPGMLIDIGTNGEIVIGGRDWLVACAASVGPALEGASVACGMVAERGAIEAVTLKDDGLRLKVIDDGCAEGICGSGIIDLLAVLLDMGVINRSAQFIKGSHPGLVFAKGRGRFILVPADVDSGRREISVSQDDVDNVITAKAAVFAATKILLDRLDLSFSDLTAVFLAGGFGSYINRENAIKIGLLPDLPVSRIQYVGNTSVWGATMAALSAEAYQKLGQIRRKTTYYDLLGSPDYVEQFSQAMFLPHTNIELFPSLASTAT